MSARDDLIWRLTTEEQTPISEHWAKRQVDAHHAEVLREAADALDESETLRDLTDDHMHDVHAAANELRRRAEEAEKDTPSKATDFFRPGHTYTASESPPYSWKFRCDTITANPDSGERTALGWRYFDGVWEPYAYTEDDWKIRLLAEHPDTATGDAT